MKQFYELADGKVTEIEVNADIAQLLANLERKDKNAARKKRWRKEISLNEMYEKTGFEPMDTSVDIERSYIIREEKDILFKAISCLSDKQQRLIRLYYYEEKNFTEIAAIVGINRRSVSKQLETIHKKLRNILD